MRYALLLPLIAVALAAQAVPGQRAPQSAASEPAPAPQRKIPCKTPENASMCYWTRGRLSFYPIGLPSYRMWKVGTNRILGIYSGPSDFPPHDSDNSYPVFPLNLERVYELETERNERLKIDTPWLIGHVFAEFEVCPLRPDRPGTMQPSCIESAKDIFVALSKHSYK